MAFVFAWHRICAIGAYENSDDIPTIDTTEIKRLINRVKQGELDQGDAQLIEKLLNFLLTIVSPSAKTHIDSANERAPVVKLTRFLSVPGTPIDNNEVERLLKRFVLFRKNSLFYKTEHGAAVGGILMSLIESCKLNNQGCRLAEMPVRGKGSPPEVRVALQDLAEVSQLRQD